MTRAAAALISPRARTCDGSSGVPEIGKFSTARWVWARQSASAGTRTSPIVSCSVRNWVSSVMAPRYPCPEGEVGAVLLGSD